MTVTLEKASQSDKSAHQLVYAGDAEVGEVWREQVSVVVSKLTEPRRMGLKWRWFAKQAGGSSTLGRGTRAAMLLGPGFKTKDEAITALVKACGLEVQ
jgi:hypothetical protein